MKNPASIKYPIPMLSVHNKVLLKTKRYCVFTVKKGDDWAPYDEPTDVVLYDKRINGYGVFASAVIDANGNYIGQLSPITQSSWLISGKTPEELLSNGVRQLQIFLKSF